MRTRRLAHIASLRTIRGSPRSALSAANSSSSLSSSETSNGSSSCTHAQCPRAGSAATSGPAGIAGWLSAIASARASASSRPARVASRVAAKPQPPSVRTRTPTPSAEVLATLSTRPLRTSRSSSSVATWRASAYEQRAGVPDRTSVRRSSIAGVCPARTGRTRALSRGRMIERHLDVLSPHGCRSITHDVIQRHPWILPSSRCRSITRRRRVAVAVIGRPPLRQRSAGGARPDQPLAGEQPPPAASVSAA